MTNTLFGKLSEIPVALLTLAGAAFAMAFNVGFFLAVGVRFLSLFSIQEHIVFSFTGCVVLVTIGVVLEQIFEAISHLFTAIKNRKLSLNTFTSWAALISLTAVLAYFTYLDAGLITALLLFGVIVLILVIVLAFYGGVRDLRIYALALFTVGMAGAYYGCHSVFSQRDHRTNWATLSEVKYGVARIGAEYSLLVSNRGVVRVAKTSDLILESDRIWKW